MRMRAWVHALVPLLVMGGIALLFRSLWPDTGRRVEEPGAPLQVFCTVLLQGPFEEIAEQFSRRFGVQVDRVYGPASEAPETFFGDVQPDLVLVDDPNEARRMQAWTDDAGDWELKRLAPGGPAGQRVSLPSTLRLYARIRSDSLRAGEARAVARFLNGPAAGDRFRAFGWEVRPGPGAGEG